MKVKTVTLANNRLYSFLYSDPDRHNDARYPLPLEPALDGEGGLVVEHLVVELFQAEGELAGEYRGAGVFLRRSPGTGSPRSP